MISAIAALSENDRSIGLNNQLLWNIPDDLKRFKELTVEHPVIMGRKTWESIPEKFRPLPDRTNIVVTRQTDFSAPGAVVVSSLDEAFERAEEIDPEEIVVIGGEQIYEQALPKIQKLYLTLVDSGEKGDTFFPDYSEFSTETFREEREHNGLRYTWINLERPTA